MPNEMTPLKAAKILTSSINIQGPVKIVTDELLARATACNYLRRVASGELTPVVHAHWRLIDLTGVKSDIPYVKYAHVECTHCRGVESSVMYSRKICPNCGALMDGKDDSHDPT